MFIGIKDIFKLIGISVVSCCAVFVCTLFLNYNLDIGTIENEITTEMGMTLYHAQVNMGKVTACVTGGCLIVTSIVMLLFYIKNYIDTHGKELGIYKAMGYSNIRVAKHFWVFGLSVFLGCFVGFAGGFLYLPTFYRIQNAEEYFPDIAVRFHPVLTFILVGLPTILFIFISVFYAYLKLKNPVLNLLYEKREIKTKKIDSKGAAFLKGVSSTTLKSKKILAFFVAFSSFCFSAMVQMSLSMESLSSETFAWMVLSIGLILAFMTIVLSLSSVVKGNAKTIMMMRVFGYSNKTCSRYILGTYRPISYIGFVIGTLYQYGLLKLVMTFVFADVENIPEYHFNFKGLAITLAAFVITYELIMYFYSLSIRKMSVKAIMLD